MIPLTEAVQRDPSWVEADFWKAAHNAGEIDTYQAYLDQYPEGNYTRLAKVFLARLEENKAKRNKMLVNAQTIVDAVVYASEVPKQFLISPRRDRAFVRPRQILMLLLWQRTAMSNKQIAGLLNKQDHTTVIHGRKVILGLLESGIEPGTEALYQKIVAALG